MRPLAAPLALLLACVLGATGPAAAAEAKAGSEAKAAALFDALAKDPTRLRIFLQAMPKGADLHNHLSGAPYAEDYLKSAADAGYCIDAAGPQLVPPPCPPETAVRGLGERDPFAFNRLVDALSTRAFQAGHGRDEVSGHTQFFSTFGRFGAIASGDIADGLASTLSLAAGDRVVYVELIHNPNAIMDHVLAGPPGPLAADGLAEAFEREAAAVAPVVTKAMAELDRDEAKARRRMDCNATSKPSPAACDVSVRYLGWVFRGLPPAQAFRSMVAAFALAARDPRFVGVNIVQPEDSLISVRDYDLHMAMFRFLSGKYPKVRRSLHAGELARGMVPPAALRDHIRKAIEVGGAERIGHGADIAFEDDAPAILAKMKRRGVAVEINLTSNAVILGVAGQDHPLALYRRAGVPVVLSTDDEGILRTDLTHEYVRAAREHGLRYGDLKAISRAGLEYAFLPGPSLWNDGQVGAPVAACAGGWTTALCRGYLQSSPKARLQVDLELQLAAFEHAVVSWIF